MHEERKGGAFSYSKIVFVLIYSGGAARIEKDEIRMCRGKRERGGGMRCEGV